MVSMVEVPLGNARAVEEGLREDAQLRRQSPPVEPKTKTQPSNESGVEARFKGKTIEDVIDMYRNAEAHIGRQANEIGQLRREVGEIISDKRRTDLAKQTPAIKPQDLLERPNEVLEQVVGGKVNEALSTLNDRFNRLEAALSGAQFTSAHPDADALTKSPEFAAWVRRTPFRSQLAARAAQGDMSAANALVSEYKDSQSTSKVDRQEEGLREAERVTLERSATAKGTNEQRERPVGRVYRRADIVRYRMEHPDLNDAESAAIDRLYLEGRVIDD